MGRLGSVCVQIQVLMDACAPAGAHCWAFRLEFISYDGPRPPTNPAMPALLCPHRGCSQKLPSKALQPSSPHPLPQTHSSLPASAPHPMPCDTRTTPQPPARPAASSSNTIPDTHFCFLVAALRPCQGRLPRRKYMST